MKIEFNVADDVDSLVTSFNSFDVSVEGSIGCDMPFEYNQMNVQREIRCGRKTRQYTFWGEITYVVIITNEGNKIYPKKPSNPGKTR